MGGWMSELTDRMQEQQDARFMELALRQAATAVSRGQTPFGAVLVDRDGRLIGEGHNTVRSDLDPTAHAEIVAIRQAWRQLGKWQMLAGGTLYCSCEPLPIVLLRYHTNLGCRRNTRNNLASFSMDTARLLWRFGSCDP
jgi:Cytidine and deoxycytidylate deaminase zinc-binding region